MTNSIGGMSGGMSASALKQMQELMFKKGDKNGDGTISKDEISQMAPPGGSQSSSDSDDIFSQLDSDGDGAINRLESDAAIARMGQQMQAQGPQGPPPPPPDEASAAGGTPSTSSTSSTSDTVAETLKALLEALDKSSSSSSSTTDSSDSSSSQLKSVLTAALQSYLQSSSSGYAQNAGVTTLSSLV